MKSRDGAEHGQCCRGCGANNALLAPRCSACGAWLRERVPALDLFATLWGTVERPSSICVRIARSEQKNYTWLLLAATGAVPVVLFLVLATIGDRGYSFADLLLHLLLLGPVTGLSGGMLAAWLLLLLFRGRTIEALAYRDTAAVLAWALSPLAWISLLILPMYFALFGITLFSNNPAAIDVRPLPFYLLTSVSVIAIAWSIILLLRCCLPFGRSAVFRFAPLLAPVLYAMLAAFGIALLYAS